MCTHNQATRQRKQTRQHGHGRQQEAGLTLIEVLMALSIVAFMLIMAWSTISSTIEAKTHFETVQERQHELRVAMARMAKDFSSAYLSGNDPIGSDNPRTLFVGKSDAPVDDIRFSSLGHVVLWADANESEQTLIHYSAESDREDPSKTNLLRRESRRLSNEQWESEPAEVDLLMRDIERVEFAYFDHRDGEWQERWDTTAADGERGRLPERVRITVTLREGDREFQRTTQARIAMQEVLEVRK